MKGIAFCRVSLAAHLRVSGPDAATFLQGQFTNELRSAAARPAVYGLWLNQKGRVLADSFVLTHGPNEFDVVSLSSPAATIRERLEGYIIADDVAVEDRTNGSGSVALVVAGDEAEAGLARLGVPTPGPGEFGLWNETLVLRGRAAGIANWLIIGDAGWAKEISDGREVTPEELAASRIAAGIAEVPAELGPRDLPNEGGLEHEAISYTKGCYLGQEVMARLRSMGQVRRRLFIVRWAAAGVAPPLAGASLHLGGRAVGELRSLLGEGESHVGLAMLHRDHVQPGAILSVGEAAVEGLQVVALAEGRAW